MRWSILVVIIGTEAEKIGPGLQCGFDYFQGVLILFLSGSTGEAPRKVILCMLGSSA